MKRSLVVAIALAAALLTLPAVEKADAHGGVYRGPGGGAPPVPPSGGSPGGSTPSPNPGPPPPSTGPTPGPAPRATSSSGRASTGARKSGGRGTSGLEHWEFWWQYNKDAFLYPEAQLRAGTYPVGTDGNYGVVLNGNWEYLGLNLWGAAMDLADGAWSDVIEQPGHFCVARQLARIDGPVTMATQLELDVLTFAWMDAANAAARIEAEHERHVLTIVDPQWNAIVPELLKNRMRKKP